MTTMELGRGTPAAGRLRITDQYFYVAMAIIIAAVVAYGFSNTVVDNLFRPIQPKVARPAILYVHAALFVSWIALFVSQTSLIRARNLRLHRRLGVAGAFLAAAMFLVGFTTAIVMRKFRIAHDPSDTPAFLSIPFGDLFSFSAAVALGVWWRKWPEYHRRLMLFATIVLTGAAFARFPLAIMNNPWFFYSGTDLLLVVVCIRELIVNRRIHPVFLYGLPAVMCVEYGGVWLFVHKPAAWLAICNLLLKLPVPGA